MLHIPILRGGRPYRSLETTELRDFRDGEPLALVSQANSGLISRDLTRSRELENPLVRFRVEELIEITRKAADLFLEGDLPLGDSTQSRDGYLESLSRTSGLPLALCRRNQEKIHSVLANIEAVLGGLTRGLDLSVLDGGYGEQGGRLLSYRHDARWLGAVLPSNSPGVHSLWVPAIALKTCLCLKPGREEPWSPYRIAQAFIAAGCPAEAFGFYPTDHGGASRILLSTERSMIFGDASTTRAWEKDERVQTHGPGWSKILFGDDLAPSWRDHLETLETSIVENGGRSCINASGVWTPREGRQLAEALAERLAAIRPGAWDDPGARLSAIANPAFAEMMDASIEQGLAVDGAVDLTREARGGEDRLVVIDGATYLLPTLIWCEDPEHPLANKEYLFPFASVVETPEREMLDRIGSTLVVTAITEDEAFRRRLLDCAWIDRLNIGPSPTCRIRWDQPHEGNLFEHLYRQRAFQHVG